MSDETEKNNEELNKEKSQDSMMSKTSPFVYNKGMQHTMTKKRDCTLKEFLTLKQNGMFTEAHEAIMKALYAYSYLNSFLIKEAVSLETKGVINLDAPACRKLIKTLLNQGLLLQYSLIHEDENGKMQGSPYIYKLSASGLRIMDKGFKNIIFRLNIFKPDDIPEIFSIAPVLSILAFNQFHITFMKQYNERPYFSGGLYFEKLNKGIRFPGRYQLHIQNTGGYLTLFVYSIRLNEDWQYGFLERLREVHTYVKQYSITGVGVIVICETERQAMDAQRYVSCDADFKDMELYFICDTTILENDDVLSQLIEVLPQENYTKRRIISLDFNRIKNEVTTTTATDK